MMHIGLDTAVFCNSSNCGTITHLIIHPQHLSLTFLILFANHVERLVPISMMNEVSEKGICLQCSLTELTNFKPFTETHFTDMPFPDYGLTDNNYSPLPTGQTWMQVPIVRYNIPPGEFAISRQTQIVAKNGHIGQFKDLVVDTDTHQITHLIFQQGHLWDRKSNLVTASLIDSMEGDTIYLNINKSDLLLK